MSGPGLTVFWFPYCFRGCAEPKGLSYCLRITDPERVAAGLNCCVAHGIVFGDWTAIAFELEPDWAGAAQLPYLQSHRPIGDFQRCHVIANQPEYIPMPRRPAKRASPITWRIWAARMAAYEAREFTKHWKGPTHV